MSPGNAQIHVKKSQSSSFPKTSKTSTKLVAMLNPLPGRLDVSQKNETGIQHACRIIPLWKRLGSLVSPHSVGFSQLKKHGWTNYGSRLPTKLEGVPFEPKVIYPSVIPYETH